MSTNYVRDNNNNHNDNNNNNTKYVGLIFSSGLTIKNLNTKNKILNIIAGARGWGWLAKDHKIVRL